MSNTRFLFVFCLAALCAIAADRPTPKQLAGPASDFLNGDMGYVNPADTAIRSKSAMLPISLENVGGDTWVWRGEVAVDNQDTFNMMVFTGQDESWQVQLRAPEARQYQNVDQLYSSYKQTSYGIEQENYEGEHFSFENMRAGSWSMKVVAESPRTTDGYLLYGTTGPYRLVSYKLTTDTLIGQSVDFVATGFNADSETMEAGIVSHAYMTVTDPYGDKIKLAMYDDGLHNDDLAGDGIYGADFLPQSEGVHKVQILARGLSPEGEPFLRTSEHLVSVVAPEVVLNEQIARADRSDDIRLKVGLDVDTFEGGLDQFRVFAEVWGKDAHGEDLAISWIGGMVYAENGRLDLGLDSRWIAYANAQGPFELRNVRIEDPDSFVTMARANAIPLQVDELPEVAFSKVNTIDDEMLMGPRPERNYQSKAGHTLMLVHGYCSSDVWGPNMGSFSNATKFTDFNKNRSHNAFAQEIASQGSGFDGYGVVAHSQGGCASLHLYTYYYSGLDYTTSGSRKIQSVGTPYQGTALAGNLAAIGDVFGAGCGTNYDLTYDGASAWLSGIPSWARAEVNYYTTSFKDRWWAYDYCHLATDLFLSDPEDGTTEKSKGQLSGAVNRGHKTGQCHTNSMRDPGQCNDGGRNSTMNSYAER